VSETSARRSRTRPSRPARCHRAVAAGTVPGNVRRGGIHCGVVNQRAGQRRTGRREQPWVQYPSPRDARSRSRSAGTVIWPRGAGRRHNTGQPAAAVDAALTAGRDAPRCQPSFGCRTPGLYSPVWVPNWGSRPPPEPPDANRPLDPEAREPACALTVSTALARTPADDDQPHGDVSISETRSPLKVKSSSDDE
jgi:hypothetical protein